MCEPHVQMGNHADCHASGVNIVNCLCSNETDTLLQVHIPCHLMPLEPVMHHSSRQADSAVGQREHDSASCLPSATLAMNLRRLWASLMASQTETPVVLHNYNSCDTRRTVWV